MSKTNVTDETTNNILGDLNLTQNVLVRSLPGMGLNTLVKNIAQTFFATPKNYVVNIYPHESQFKNFREIERLVLEKFAIENGVGERNVYSLPSLVNFLQKNNHILLIVLHKLNAYVQTKKYIDFFDSLYRSSNGSIKLLISADYAFFSQIKKEELAISTNDYVFEGFIKNFEAMFNRMVEQYDVARSVIKEREKVFALTLGNVGLVKSILISYKKHKKLLPVDELIKDPEISRRASEVFQSLNISNLNLSDLGEKKARDHKTNDLKERDSRYDKAGLFHKGKFAELLVGYYLKKELPKDNVYKALTQTEGDIYRILSDSVEEYVTLDQLAFLLKGSNFDTLSDWSMYKHINNINKKLARFGIEIENKRARGYRLAKVSQ